MPGLTVTAVRACRGQGGTAASGEGWARLPGRTSVEIAEAISNRGTLRGARIASMRATAAAALLRGSNAGMYALPKLVR